jgi:hypothetical protein
LERLGKRLDCLFRRCQKLDGLASRVGC